jgi:hypothetical protein
MSATNHSITSNSKCEGLKIVVIGQSATEHPGNRMKAQRPDLVDLLVRPKNPRVYGSDVNRMKIWSELLCYMGCVCYTTSMDTKTCPKCLVEKSLDGFHKSKSCKFGRASYCKSCVNETSAAWEKRNPDRKKAKWSNYYDKYKERIKANRKKREKMHPEKHKDNQNRWRLKSVYGLTPEMITEKIAKQDNKCSICTRTFSEEIKPVVDHNHVTDVVRDMLCAGCNIRLGHIEKGGNFLTEALKYLERHKGAGNQ